MPSARQQLLRLLAERSFRLGHFTLASGAVSDYYIDCRLTTLSAEGAHATGLAVLEEIRARGWNPQAIGGLTLGADPIVVAVAVLSADASQTDGRAAQPIHAFIVRKAEKQHGTGQRIEGFQQKGARVVIVDDVCTTGASTIQAMAAARTAGMQVVGVICLVDREEQNGLANVQQAAGNVPFVALFTAHDIRKEHERIGGSVDRVTG